MNAAANGCYLLPMDATCCRLLLPVIVCDQTKDKKRGGSEISHHLYHARSKEQSEKSFKVFLRRTIGMEWKVECSGMADSKYWNGMALQTAYGWMDLYAMPGSICIVGRYTRADS